MYRFVAFSLVCVFAISTSRAGEPPSRHQNDLSEIKRLLSDLNRRVAKIENPIRNHRAGDDVSIRFDQLRIPYETDDERELAQSQIATKGREAFFGGHLSKDAGWQQISVEDSCDMQSHVIRAAAISLETGLMSKILDDDEALYILRVTHRPK